MRPLLVIAALGALAGCDAGLLSSDAPVEEFVISDPGSAADVMTEEVAVVEVPAELAPSDDRRPAGCPPGADVLYGGTRYCVQGLYR